MNAPHPPHPPHRPYRPYRPYRPQALCLLLAILILSLTSANAQTRLTDASDRAAFQWWFALLADSQFDQPAAEVTDCAALVRFAYREAIRAHTPEWSRRIALPFTAMFPDVRSGPKATPSGWPLFRIAPGDPRRFAEFADARTLIALNSKPLGRHIAARQPGDLLYFRQPSQSRPDHLMVVAPMYVPDVTASSEPVRIRVTPAGGGSR